MKEFLRDNKSMGDASDRNVRTWCVYHDAWWNYLGDAVPVWPLTPANIDAVGAAMQKSSHRSMNNYGHAAKDEHIA